MSKSLPMLEALATITYRKLGVVQPGMKAVHPLGWFRTIDMDDEVIDAVVAEYLQTAWQEVVGAEEEWGRGDEEFS